MVCDQPERQRLYHAEWVFRVRAVSLSGRERLQFGQSGVGVSGQVTPGHEAFGGIIDDG